MCGQAVAYRVDMTVDWSGSTSTTMPSSTLSQDGIFGVRWVGFVRPSKAQQYTFHIPLVAAATDRVKLWVDNSIIIQQWASIGSTAPSGTIGFAAGNGYYDISMVFKSTVPALNGYQLMWENTGSGVPKDDTSKGRIPSTRLFQVSGVQLVVMIITRSSVVPDNCACSVMICQTPVSRVVVLRASQRIIQHHGIIQRFRSCLHLPVHLSLLHMTEFPPSMA